MHTALPEVEALKDIGQELRQSNERDVNVQIARFEERLREYLMEEGMFEHRGGPVNLCTIVADIYKRRSRSWDDDYMQTSEDFEELSKVVDRPYRSEE